MKPPVSPLQAIGLAVLGYTLWVLADSSLKVAGSSPLRAVEIIGVLGLLEAAMVLGYGLVRRDLRSLWPTKPVQQVLRSCLDLGNNVCVVIALRHLPLPLFYILVFLAPLCTALLGAALLKETLDWRRGLAIGVGFAGVVVAVDPLHAAHAGSGVGYLACMACVACFSVSIVWSRTMTQTESSASILFCSGLVTGLPGGLSLLLRPVPVGSRVLAVLTVAALFCIFGSLCFLLALRHAAAATVSQYHYTQLLTGALVSYLVWHVKPTAAMAAGAVLIAGAGIYTASRSRSPAEPETALHLLAVRD